MFSFNIHNILLILGINKLILGIVIYFLKTQNSRIKGIDYWSLGSVLTALGLIIYSFIPPRANLQIDFIFSLLLNFFFFVGEVLFLIGFWKYLDKKTKNFVFLIPIIAVLNVIFTLFHQIFWLRYSINSFLGAILCIISFFVLLKYPSKKLNLVFKITAYIYLIYAFIQLVRAIFAIIFKPQISAPSYPIIVWVIGIAGVLMILLTFNLIIIISTTLNEELEKQISTKNKLYAIIAHDLRGPIGSLISLNSFIIKNIQENKIENALSIAQEIEKSSNATRFLIENTLSWSLSQLSEIKINFSQNSLLDIIKNSIEISKKMASEKSISIELKTNQNFIFKFDKEMISIVVRNLISNAIKFSNNESKIEIDIFDKDSFICVSIKDYGIGMSKEKIETLFNSRDNISTIGTKYEKGYGFGLPLCKEIIELHKGSIYVKSQKNIGSVFTFILPIIY